MIEMSDWTEERRRRRRTDIFAKVDLVFDDDYSKWSNVARAIGVEEEIRSRIKSLGRATGSSSSSQHTPHEGETREY